MAIDIPAAPNLDVALGGATPAMNGPMSDWPATPDLPGLAEPKRMPVEGIPPSGLRHVQSVDDSLQMQALQMRKQGCYPKEIATGLGLGAGNVRSALGEARGVLVVLHGQTEDWRELYGMPRSEKAAGNEGVEQLVAEHSRGVLEAQDPALGAGPGWLERDRSLVPASR
jgi:hypothetical protein